MENETEATQVEEQQVQTQQQEAVTQQAQETVESLRSQLGQIQEQLKKREDDVRGLNRTLQQRAEEAKKQDNLRGEIAGIQDTIELLATAISAKGQLEDVEPSERQDIMAELRKRKEQQEAKRKELETQSAQQQYAQRADAVYSRAKSIYGDNDDAIERIEELLMNGRIDRAETRVAKAEQGKGDTAKVESEEQRIDRLVNERLQKKLQEEGLLESFTATPSGGGGSVADAMAKYAAGEITTEEAKKRGVKFN